MIYMDKAATSYHKPEEVAKAVYEAVKATGNSGRGANSASLTQGRNFVNFLMERILQE